MEFRDLSCRWEWTVFEDVIAFYAFLSKKSKGRPYVGTISVRAHVRLWPISD